MPVSFNSPPRNFFLLGNSGSQAVTNFFHEEVKPMGSNLVHGMYEPSEIRYNTPDQKFILASTVASESTSKRRVGFIEKRGYDAETDPANPTTTAGFGNNKPDAVKIQSGGEDGTFVKTDTYLTAMEFGNNDSIVACGYLKEQSDSATSTLWIPMGRGFIPWVGKFTSSGEKEWMVTSNTGDLQYTGITTDSSNNIYLCGNSVTPLNDPASSYKKPQGWIEKVDVDGSYVWGQNTRFLGRDVVISKIDSNDSNQVVAVGYIDDNNGKRGYIIKLDSGTGDVVWDKTLTYHHFESTSMTGQIGQQDHVICTDIFIDSKEQMYVVGYHGGGPNRQFIIKYSKEGNLIWQKESDNPVLVMDGTNYIPSDVWSDGETEQTIVLSEVSTNQPQSTIMLTKFSKNGDEVWCRTLTKGSSGMEGTPHQSLDADESFYYLLLNTEAEDANNLKSESYTFGKVSASGNGLGAFQYDDGSGAPLFDYEIDQFITHRNGRLKEGSVTNNTGDLMGYPFGANKILFDDFATNITNKKRQVDDPNVFEYGDSTASPRSPEKESSNAIVFSSSRGIVDSEWKEEDYYKQLETYEFPEVTGVTGQQEYTTPGSYTWTAPAGVTSVCVVCVGAGGAGGGALAYKNDITVVPGTGYNVVVGAPGSMATGTTGSGAGQNTGTSGGNSTFQATHGTTIAQGGITGAPDANDPKGSPAGDYDGGGNGGITYNYGGYSGGGAGGYSGDGGGAGSTDPSSGVARPGSGGGGGAGSWAYNSGGGVGIYGEGVSGAGNTNGDGFGGSGGQNGQGEGSDGGQVQVGGNYGGGASGRWAGNKGGNGAVRLIWGPGRAFPSTLTADQTPTGEHVPDITSKVGTITGASWNSDGYWSFAGNNGEYIDIEGITGDFSKITVEVWFYCDVIDNHHNIIDCNFGTPDGGSVSSGNIGPRLEMSSGNALTWVWGSLVSQNDPFNYHSIAYSTGSNAGNLDTGRWYCAAFTCDGDAAANGTGYLDGIKSNQTRGTNTSGTTGWLGTIDHKIRLGGGFVLGGTERYHDGRIGDVRIWPRVLSRAEIWQSYNSNRSRFMSRPYKKPYLITDNIKFDEAVERNYDFNNQACIDWSENWIVWSTSLEKLVDSDVGNGSWSQTVKDNDAIAPDGTKTAHSFLGSGNTTRHTIRFKDTGSASAGSNNNFPSPAWSCFSVYVKANGWNYIELETASYAGWNSPGGASFDIVNGSVSSSFSGTGGQGIQSIGNGWYRVWAYCEVASNSAAGWYINLSNDLGITNQNVGTDQGIYVWGYQNEEGKKPTQWNRTMGMIVDKGSPEFGAIRVEDLAQYAPQEYEKTNDRIKRAGVLVNCTLRENFHLGDTLNSPNYINFDTEGAHLKFYDWTTDTTGGQTDAFWIRLNGNQPGSTWNYLLYSNFASIVHEWGVFGNNNSIFRFKENSSQTNVTYDIGIGTWRHVALRILPNQTISMWVDGVNVANDGSNTVPAGNIQYVQLMGDSGATSGDGLVGDLGEYQQWGYAMSDTEMAKLYTETRYKYGV